MALETITASLPATELQGGMSIVFEAIDPIDGTPVPGISVNLVAIYGEDTGGGGFAGTFGPFMLVPGPHSGL